MTTQKEKLRKKFNSVPEDMYNFFYYAAEEVRNTLAHMGYKSLSDVRGERDVGGIHLRGDLEAACNVLGRVSWGVMGLGWSVTFCEVLGVRWVLPTCPAVMTAVVFRTASRARRGLVAAAQAVNFWLLTFLSPSPLYIRYVKRSLLRAI